MGHTVGCVYRCSANVENEHIVSDNFRMRVHTLIYSVTMMNIGKKKKTALKSGYRTLKAYLDLHLKRRGEGGHLAANPGHLHVIAYRAITCKDWPWTQLIVTGNRSEQLHASGCDAL